MFISGERLQKQTHRVSFVYDKRMAVHQNKSDRNRKFNAVMQ